MTNIPIESRDKVYTFFLLEGKHYDKYVGHHCYPDVYYNCLPFHVKGEYDDYGGVDKFEGDFIEDIEEAFKDHLFEMELGKNQYHDHEVKKEGFDLERFMIVDHGNRLYVHPHEWDKQRGVEKRRLTHIQIREGALDNLLDLFKIEWCNSETGYSTKRSSFQTIHEQEFPKLQDAIKKFTSKKNQYKKLGIYNEQDDLFQELYFGGKIKQSPAMSFALDSYYLKQHVISPYKLMEKYIDDEEKMKSIYNQMIIYQFLSAFMHKSRRVWIKPSGEGSQSDDLKVHRVFSKILNSELKTVSKSHRDREEEYQDWVRESKNNKELKTSG